MEALFFANWTRQTRKGLLELVVLNDIGNRGAYAYEMERTLCRCRGLLMSTGAIYRMLGRLTGQRLIKATARKSPRGPQRKYYELTPAGRATLRQMNVYWDAIRIQIQTVMETR